MSIQAISFDLIGTLIKKPGPLTEQDYSLLLPYLRQCGYNGDAETFFVSWHHCYKTMTAESTKSNTEFAMEEVCEAVFSQMTATADPAVFCQKYLEIWNKKATLVSDVQPTLAALSKHFTLLIISNAHYAPLVHDNLQKHQLLKYFRHIATSIEHGHKKPSASIFLDSCKQVQLQPHQMLHVGDSYNEDYVGATSAGLQARLLDPTLSHEVPTAHRLHHIAQLVEVMLTTKNCNYGSGT